MQAIVPQLHSYFAIVTVSIWVGEFLSKTLDIFNIDSIKVPFEAWMGLEIPFADGPINCHLNTNSFDSVLRI